MHTFFYISGIVLWIGIAMYIIVLLMAVIIAQSIPNEVDENR